jgi:hypothetical protein
MPTSIANLHNPIFSVLHTPYSTLTPKALHANLSISRTHTSRQPHLHCTTLHSVPHPRPYSPALCICRRRSATTAARATLSQPTPSLHPAAPTVRTPSARKRRAWNKTGPQPTCSAHGFPPPSHPIHAPDPAPFAPPIVP